MAKFHRKTISLLPSARDNATLANSLVYNLCIIWRTGQQEVIKAQSVSTSVLANGRDKVCEE